MAAVKTLRTIIAAATSNAGSATTTGTAIDLTTKYGALLTAKITNGGTAPSVAAQVNVYTSADNTNFKLLCSLVGDLVNSSVNQWTVEIPATCMYVRADITGNLTQAVTGECFAQELTSL